KEMIDKELARGTTIIEATGGFTNETKKMILCVVSQRQYTKLLQLIRTIDDKAFVITTDAVDMHGEGFTYSSPNL
ncbi:MAG: YitT family protein, partial [Solobacterium sp.]|nr:YitT family protein [Solobacterium sp.]